MMRWISAALLLGLGQSNAFAPSSSSSGVRSPPSTTYSFLAAFTADVDVDADDILKPSYEIEPLPFRIGHGFDIHRMAPLEEAGQPVVIGGVEIPHKDQKVRLFQQFQCSSANAVLR